MSQGDVIRFRRGTAARWMWVNPILDEGEPGYETDTSRMKIGDGFTPWGSLPYSSDGGGSGGDPLALVNHINSPEPHPVYDDMQSLVGLFENGLL